MKYIDSDKLIERLEEMKRAEYENCGGVNSKTSALQEVQELIASLQHKQPESICPRCAYHNKTDDFCEYPYGGRKCSINENGVYECNGFEVVEQQDQPEVDLEKFADKIKTFQGRYKYPEVVSIKGAMAFMARMFYQYPNVARQWYDSLPKATMD